MEMAFDPAHPRKPKQQGYGQPFVLWHLFWFYNESGFALLFCEAQAMKMHE
jgi:hypothetical protein